jgi:hypothetical protein
MPHHALGVDFLTAAAIRNGLDGLGKKKEE